MSTDETEFEEYLNMSWEEVKAREDKELFLRSRVLNSNSKKRSKTKLVGIRPALKKAVYKNLKPEPIHLGPGVMLDSDTKRLLKVKETIAYFTDYRQGKIVRIYGLLKEMTENKVVLNCTAVSEGDIPLLEDQPVQGDLTIKLNCPIPIIRGGPLDERVNQGSYVSWVDIDGNNYTGLVVGIQGKKLRCKQITCEGEPLGSEQKYIPILVKE